MIIFSSILYPFRPWSASNPTPATALKEAKNHVIALFIGVNQQAVAFPVSLLLVVNQQFFPMLENAVYIDPYISFSHEVTASTKINVHFYQAIQSTK